MVNLTCGDCFQTMKQMKDKSVNLVITDPPYWHKKSPGKPYSQRKKYTTNSKFANSDLFNAEGEMMSTMSDFTDVQINDLLNELKRVMIKMNAYIFCNDTQLAYYAIWAEENSYMFSVLCWEKPARLINKNRFAQNIEYIIRIYEYGTGLNKVELNDYYNKVKRVMPVKSKEKRHPTQKPTELIKQFVVLSSKEGDIVFDPFMGSGTTGVVCVDTNRNFIGVELTEKYFKVAQDRIATASENKNYDRFNLWGLLGKDEGNS